MVSKLLKKLVYQEAERLITNSETSKAFANFKNNGFLLYKRMKKQKITEMAILEKK